MHDIWNPWHGCRKYSEGCDHCYMYYLDSLRDVNSTLITKTNNFNYPLQKKRDGSFKVGADGYLYTIDDWIVGDGIKMPPNFYKFKIKPNGDIVS